MNRGEMSTAKTAPWPSMVPQLGLWRADQNILLEAQIQSLTKTFAEEKNILLKANLELQQKYDALVRGNKKQPKAETSTFEDGGTD